MSKIEVSTAFSQGINGRVFGADPGPRADQNGYGPHTLSLLVGCGSGNYPYYTTWFRLMKGTKPPLPDAANVMARDADALVTWYNYPGVNVPGYSATASNPIWLGNWYTAATQSGTATWFWWYVKSMNPPLAGSQNNTNGFVHEIIGTVGGVGSGADLELAYPNIVTGINYRIQGIQVQLPTEWTY